MLSLILALLSVRHALTFAPCHVFGRQESAAALQRDVILGSHDADGDSHEEAVCISDVDAVSQSRRLMLMTIPALAFTSGELAQATTGSIRTTKIKPQTAYEGLIKARDELQQAQKKYLQKKDYEGLRDYLRNAENINNFEPNALAILASKRLDDEDKKAIGTIRRYGSGADVLIMYGGLLAEIDEGNENPDYDIVQKYMVRTMESLDEVISICRNGGFV